MDIMRVCLGLLHATKQVVSVPSRFRKPSWLVRGCIALKACEKASHYPASAWECSPEVNLPRASLAVRCTLCQPSQSPEKGSAAIAEVVCPALQLGQGNGGTGTLPIFLFPSLPHFHALSSSWEILAGVSSDLCWTWRSCWDPK